MFDKCPLIKRVCGFCCKEKNEYMCGFAKEIKYNKKGILVEAKIKLLDKCPLKKENENLNTLIKYEKWL